MGSPTHRPGTTLSAVQLRRITSRIGLGLQTYYGDPEEEGLPAEHVQLLLKLRHRERERTRKSSQASFAKSDVPA